MKNILVIISISFLCLNCKKFKEANKNPNIQSLNHNGVIREYLTFIPSNYKDTQAVPVVLNFHGFGGNISDYSTYASMERIADLENFILVYPQGTDMDEFSHWNPSLPGSDNKSSADDFGFIEMLIEKLSADYSIDAKRIYACGFSNGGMMSFGLVNHKSDLIAAVACVSGSMLETDNTPNHPKPVLMIHGTSDGVIPYIGNNDYTSVESTLSFWRNFNSTDSTPYSNTITTGGNSIEYTSYSNGNNGVSVEHYKINQGGHEWFNLNYEGKNTGELIWNFFSKYDIDGLIE
tara:strand:- start:3462 stop:4334 length:873 start_codon:yes stop_codon:yes gene_type:complete